MWAESILQNSSWDRLRGERHWEPVGTLGGDGRSVRGVTTLGGNGTLGMFECELSFVISFAACCAWASSIYGLMRG
jgi:hypothetical protein